MDAEPLLIRPAEVAMNNRVDAPANAIRRLREDAGLTQEDLARRLRVDGNTVSRWELGKVIPQLAQRRRLAEELGVSIGQLLIPTRANVPNQPSPLALILEEPPILAVDSRIEASQHAWAVTRAGLNANRPTLAERAADTYPAGARYDGTTLLAAPGWLPDEPIDLRNVRLNLEDPPAPELDGTEREVARVLPLADLARPYGRYTAAIRDVAKPRLLCNRLSWRLTGIDWAARRLGFAETSYFECIDVHEALAHETACVHLDDRGQLIERRPALRDLPFRRLVGDPFDLGRRPVLASVSTLVVRGGDEPSFLLHRRDSAAVAIAGSMIHVVPTGVFQPSSVRPAARVADFDLWRNVMREFSEELLGNAEHDGDGHPVDYRSEPFAALDAALADGRLRATCVGIGLDALTLVAEVLTVAVFDPDLFDRLAADFVAVNDEGSMVADRVDFNEPTVTGLLASGRVAPAASGLLALAWQHRDRLL